MDLNKWINVLKGIPKEKLKTDAGLREVLRDIGKKMGKSFSEQELDRYVAQFRRMSRTETPANLMNKLAQKGVNKDAIDSIKKRFFK